MPSRGYGELALRVEGEEGEDDENKVGDGPVSVGVSPLSVRSGLSEPLGVRLNGGEGVFREPE